MLTGARKLPLGARKIVEGTRKMSPGTAGIVGGGFVFFIYGDNGWQLPCSSCSSSRLTHKLCVMPILFRTNSNFGNLNTVKLA